MKINKGDRSILILLIILLVGYVAYAALHRDTSLKEDPELLSTPSDTTPPPTGTPDTLLSTPSTERSTCDTLPIHTALYPGPPDRQIRSSAPKLSEGATIDLNTADTLLLQRVPGIGPVFARRIVKYRDLLGGYYVVEQLQEVYGMDRERYDQIAPYLVIHTHVRPLTLSQDSIPYHPYLQWRHRKVLLQLLRHGAPFTWNDLMSSPAFTQDDSLRLSPYLSLSPDNNADRNPTP